MYGDDGWCRGCGTPLREQVGSLRLRGSGFPAGGAWVPYWFLDTFCVDSALAARIGSEFNVDVRPVLTAKGAPTEAFQVVVPTLGPDWFDASELSTRTMARHGATGARCPTCGTWRWFPLPDEDLMGAISLERFDHVDHGAIASPEYFGDGMESFRQVLVQRELAVLLAKASPRDLWIAG